MARFRSLAPAQALWLAFGAFLLATLPSDAGVLNTPATNVVAALSATYAGVTNLTCTVRREVPDGRSGGTETLVSRVVWARGDRMNVESLAPIRRRVVIDGAAVWVGAPGDSRPSRRDIADQSAEQFANLRSVPSSPEELLAPLDPATAEERTPVAPWARSVSLRPRATNALARAVVVSFDAEGRVGQLESFDASGASLSLQRLDGAFEPLPGAWLYRRTVTEATLHGRSIRTVSRFESIRVNEDIPAAMFDAKAFF